MLSATAIGQCFCERKLFLIRSRGTATNCAWLQLLTDGTFSNASLERLPGSFQVDPLWYGKLQASAEKQACAGGGGATWLHHLLMGTIELERAHSAQAGRSLAQSHKLKPNPHAARALALLAPTPAAAWVLYKQGWASLQPSGGFGDSAKDPLRDAVMDALIREMCEFCRSTGMVAELKSFLATVTEAKLRDSDAVKYSVAALAMNVSDWKTAMATIGGSCWPTYVGSTHLGLLSSLWEVATYARYAEEEGLTADALTPLQGQKVSFQWKNPDFLIKNPDFLSKGLDLITQTGTAEVSSAEEHRGRWGVGVNE